MRIRFQSFNFFDRRVIDWIATLGMLWAIVENPFSLDDKMNKVICIALFMIYSWISELLPYAITALVPLVAFPLLGVGKINDVAKAYADPVIFLFLGGFLLALAIEKWNLHKRIALYILQKTGSSNNRIVLGFLLSSFLLSMWISNTATAMMMFPIALSVIYEMGKNLDSRRMHNLTVCVLLCVAYGANLGGLATKIGTPPNIVFVGYIEAQTDHRIDFLQWLAVCLPIACCIGALFYFVLTQILYPSKIQANESPNDFLRIASLNLGAMTRAENRVLLIFVLTALAWMGKDLVNYLLAVELNDTVIALMAGISLFVVPSGTATPDQTVIKPNTRGAWRLLEWRDTEKMAWGILLMFGGGLSLAKGLEECGLMDSLARELAAHSHLSVFSLAMLIIIFSIFLSEVLSNVAQVIILTPVIISLADNLHLNPIYLGIPMTLAASCASMLPMGTPPNAIVFSSGKVPIREMLTTGLVLNLLSIIVIALLAPRLISIIF